MAASSQRSLIFRQLFDTSGSSTYTYLLADNATKEGVLIDPVLEMVDRDLAIVKDLGIKLVAAVNTHCHADHVTGTGELKRRVQGLRSGIALASSAAADFHFSEGDTVPFGSHALRVVATPGHTDGCVSFLCEGMAFTGDALLIRGCGRTDFQQGDSAKLYEGIHSKLFSLAPETLVYPAHDYQGRMVSTIGEERSLNPRFTKSKEEFITLMAALNLPKPKRIDEVLPKNLVCGV